MGCCGYCKEVYQQFTNRNEMLFNYSDNIIEIGQNENKPENKDFFNLNNQKQINENINFNNSNTATNYNNNNNNQKNKLEIKNLKKDNNNSKSSDNKRKQINNKKRNVNRHHIESNIGQKISSKHNNRAVASAVFGGIGGVFSAVTDDKIDKNNNLKKNSFSTNNLLNSKNLTSANLSAKINKKKDLEPFDDKKLLLDIKSSKKLSFKKKLDFSSLKLDIPAFSSNLFSHKMTKSLSENNIPTKTFNSKNIKLKSYSKRKKDEFMSWSKNIYLNPKYFRRYMKLDKLMKKELNFQKDILNLKSNNSKLYHNSFAKDIFINAKDREQERNQDYMILTEKIYQKVLNSQKEYEKLIYFNKKKKQVNKLKNRNNNDILDDEILGINKNLNLDGSDEEEEKNFNEINKNSIMKVNEKLRNIIYKIRERKRMLKKMKHENNG